MAQTTSAAKLGSEILVNTTVAGPQGLPTVTGLSNGNFVVTWSDSGSEGIDTEEGGISAQVFSAGGQKIGGEFLVNTVAAAGQGNSVVTALQNGRFVVSWMDYSGQGGDDSGSGIKAQIFNADGSKSGQEFLVNSITAAEQVFPAITGLGGGGFVASWNDYSQQGRLGAKAQIFDGTGQPVGGEFFVNEVAFGYQLEPTITGLANGGFVVSWYDYGMQGGDNSDAAVRAQVFNASGQKVGGVFLVNTAVNNAQGLPSIAGLSNGNFVVTWTDASLQGGDSNVSGIKAQIFSPAGAKVGSEFLVNTTKPGIQTFPAVTDLANGNFVITWRDSSGAGGDNSGTSIKAQVFSATGVKVGSEFLVNTQTAGDQENPEISGLANGDFVVTWADYGSGDIDVKAQVFHFVTTHTGTTGDDTLTGGAGTDVMNGGAGNDRLDGGASADIMTGSTGDDTYVVDDAGDQVIELAGAGQGVDTVETALNNYTLQTQVENLVITGTGAVNVNGNELANEITGNAGRNVIYAGAGDDTIHSGGGDDYLDGGTGADTFHGGSGNTQYVFDTVGDKVIGEVAGGGNDTIWSSVSVNLNDQGMIEVLRLNGSGNIDGTGNALANTITGSSGNNAITGGLGNDTLYGKGGADIFVFAEMGAANTDSIWDFDADDKIRLDASVFQGLGVDAGHLAAANFVKGAAATVAGRPTIIYTDYTGILSYDADGKGGAAAQEIAFVGKKLAFFDHNDIVFG